MLKISSTVGEICARNDGANVSSSKSQFASSQTLGCMFLNFLLWHLLDSSSNLVISEGGQQWQWSCMWNCLYSLRAHFPQTKISTLDLCPLRACSHCCASSVSLCLLSLPEGTGFVLADSLKLFSCQAIFIAVLKNEVCSSTLCYTVLPACLYVRLW